MATLLETTVPVRNTGIFCAEVPLPAGWANHSGRRGNSRGGFDPARDHLMPYDWENDKTFELLCLEDKIAEIIKDEYDSTGYHDEGRSDSAAHQIMTLLHGTDPNVINKALHDFKGKD